MSEKKISLTEAARIARGDLKPPTKPIRFDGEKRPVGCLKCGTEGPLAEVGADHAGWLCPSCYAALQASDPTHSVPAAPPEAIDMNRPFAKHGGIRGERQAIPEAVPEAETPKPWGFSGYIEVLPDASSTAPVAPPEAPKATEPLPCPIPTEAILSAAKFARDLARRSRHTEAVSDCTHCTLSFLATWVEQLLIEIGRKCSR